VPTSARKSRRRTSSTPEPEPLFLTTRQAARLLNCSQRTIQYLAKSQELPSIEFGSRGHLRVPRKAILRLVPHDPKSARAIASTRGGTAASGG